jgi:hypothetical protein
MFTPIKCDFQSTRLLPQQSTCPSTRQPEIVLLEELSPRTQVATMWPADLTPRKWRRSAPEYLWAIHKGYTPGGYPIATTLCISSRDVAPEGAKVLRRTYHPVWENLYEKIEEEAPKPDEAHRPNTSKLSAEAPPFIPSYATMPPQADSRTPENRVSLTPYYSANPTNTPSQYQIHPWDHSTSGQWQQAAYLHSTWPSAYYPSNHTTSGQWQQPPADPEATPRPRLSGSPQGHYAPNRAPWEPQGRGFRQEWRGFRQGAGVRGRVTVAPHSPINISRPESGELPNRLVSQRSRAFEALALGGYGSLNEGFSFEGGRWVF